MDAFLRDTYVEIFKKWILFQEIDQFTITLGNDGFNDVITIKTNYGIGFITFYPLNIIELRVVRKKTEELTFFLHFELTNLKHATELFNEMIEAMKLMIHKPSKKLLLCCSSGFTTTYFASQIQEAINILHMNYEIEATSYTKLFEKGEDFDVIMLAPQVGYNLARTRAIFKDKVVFTIPPAIFAEYNVEALFDLIKAKIAKYNAKSKNQRVALDQIENIVMDTTVLCISLFRNTGPVHIAYRLYGPHVKILEDTEVIKQRITIQDIYDIIDTILLRYPEVEYISLAAPGIINDGMATTANINGFAEMNYKQLIGNRYSQKLIVENDVNAAVCGYSALEHITSSLVFLFQPATTYAGAGTIINGQLVTGRRNVAGEVQYLPKHSVHHVPIVATPEAITLTIRDIVLSFISTLAPDTFVIFCTLLPYIDDLQKSLEGAVPTAYIPNLIKVDDIQDYIFPGLVYLTLSRPS